MTYNVDQITKPGITLKLPDDLITWIPYTPKKTAGGCCAPSNCLKLSATDRNVQDAQEASIELPIPEAAIHSSVEADLEKASP